MQVMLQALSHPLITQPSFLPCRHPNLPRSLYRVKRFAAVTTKSLEGALIEDVCLTAVAFFAPTVSRRRLLRHHLRLFRHNLLSQQRHTIMYACIGNRDMIGKIFQQSSGSVGNAPSAGPALKKYKIAQPVSLACLHYHHHLHSHTDASHAVHTFRLCRSLMRYQELLQ